MELISAKYLLPMNGEPIQNGAMVIEDGKIIEVGKTDDLVRHYPQAKKEDFPQHALMPGLINAHTHLDMGGHKNYPFDPVRTLVPEVNFVEWLLSSLEYKKSFSSEIIRGAISEGIASMVESGTTCVGDMGSFEGIFQILSEAGLRGVVFPEIINYDRFATQDLYESALALVEKYQENETDLIRVGLAPYSPYTLSRNVLKVLASYCRSVKLPLMIHAAESFSEMEFFYNASGDMATRLFPQIGWGEQLPPAFCKTPIAYLEEIDFLKSQPILVGCVQTTPDDHERIVKSQTKVILTPRSNHYLKLGEAKLNSLHKKGAVIALGTDGLPSVNNFSLWEEMRFTHETFMKGKETSLAAEDLIKMVTINAAKVLGLDQQVGSLEADKQADYIAVKVDSEMKGDIYQSLIQNTKSYHIHKVVVHGVSLKSIH